MLVLGRAIAGLTSANMAVATAYITDISAEEERAKRFGYFHAMFGIGFIIGPVLGGVLGDWWVRAPFIAAALLNGLNFALALFVLPESRQGDAGARFDAKNLNPFRPLGWALTFAPLLPLMAIFVIMNFVGTMYGTIWALFGEDAFGWSALMIGLSLGTFGVFHAGAQAFLTGPAVKRLGERWALIVGMAFELTALVVLGFATQGWILFALAPLFALGRHRHAGTAVADDAAGRRRQPGQAAGRAGEPRQPLGGVRAAVLQRHLLRLQAPVARARSGSPAPPSTCWRCRSCSASGAARCCA